MDDQNLILVIKKREAKQQSAFDAPSGARCLTKKISITNKIHIQHNNNDENQKHDRFEQQMAALAIFAS